jgi:hypothetical protein
MPHRPYRGGRTRAGTSSWSKAALCTIEEEDRSRVLSCVAARIREKMRSRE